MASERYDYLLIGEHAEDRRVRLFQQALKDQGREPAWFVSHREALQGRLEDLPDRPFVVRLEALGGDPATRRELLRLGREDAQEAGATVISDSALGDDLPRPTELLCPRQQHFGFLRYLRRLEETYRERPNWRPTASPSTLAELFDKRRTSTRYARLGLPVPEALNLPIDLPMDAPVSAGPDLLRDAMLDAGWPSVFVKLSCGSSASGLAVYFFRQADAEHGSRGFLLTTIHRGLADRDTTRGRHNSLKLQRLDDPADIDEVLAFLLREGSLVERAVPKARLDGAFMDCRVLTVAGEPTFWVVRQNRHPITNLHLGGWRGNVAELRRRVQGDAWQAALDSCRRVAAAHDTFQLGIDLMFEPGFRGHRILESNAFGDLLPGLEKDGLDVYGWQIEHVGPWLARRA